MGVETITMLLRSWVQIPPGPSFPVVQLRYWFERVLNKCRTNSAATHIEDTQRLVSEIEMFKVVLYLVRREKSSKGRS
jgi:hypothetical protein